MATNCGILLIALCAVAAGEVVYIDDLNDDHSKRNLDLGLPETINVRLRRLSGDLDLTLVENKRLNADAPIYLTDDADKLENTRVLKQDVRATGRVKFYQAKDLSAYVSVECRRETDGPCVRTLTGNVYVDGAEHKIEPINDVRKKREIDSHLGTPHSLEVLERGSTGTDTDFVVPGTEDLSKEEQDKAKQKEVERIEERIKTQPHLKGATAKAHGIELLLLVDHLIYQTFAKRYTGDETILLKIREYYAHLINGVDLRYGSIQEDDVSFYVTIAAFVISKKVSTSPWMDYSVKYPDCSKGLHKTERWIQGSTIPAHDHAMLITGSDISNGGSRDTVGTTSMSGVCKYSRASINEEDGFFQGTGTFAHELAHNLGSPHDSGSASSGCSPDANYIMTPYVHRLEEINNINPWRFSKCSINSFRLYVNSLGAGSCTLNRARIWDKDEFDKHTKALTGQLYSEDQQCELLMGKGAIMCASNKNTADICRNFRCQPSGGSCRRFIAAHGTPCGHGMLCFEGICRKHDLPVVPDYLKYKGKCANTATGGTCQRWDSQSPHKHGNTNAAQYPDATLADAGNYCRDPDRSGFLWCYTTSTVRLQKCNVMNCVGTAPVNYQGTCAHSATGLLCQRWDSQYPHKHIFGSTGAHNYCRDPNNAGFQWCYTTSTQTWEKCNVNNCVKVNKLSVSNYKGTCASTASGRTCQRWDAQYPHKPWPGLASVANFPDASVAAASNYCRDPNKAKVLWCYTIDKYRGWEVCNPDNCPGNVKINSASLSSRSEGLGEKTNGNPDARDVEKRMLADEKLPRSKILKLMEKLLETA